MKKTIKFIATSLMLVLMSSSLCFAAEKQDIPENIPERIEVENGVLELVNDAPVSVSPQGIARYQYRVKTDGGNLNVRKGPGTNYAVIGQFANGTIVDIPYDQGNTPDGWFYAGGKDCNTGKEIKGYVADQYIFDID